jgi:uncharacterized protein YndB with AHSA1/START domain
MSTPIPFVISRLFNASPQRIYEAWADPSKMAQWSGPKGSTVEILQGAMTVGYTTVSRTSSAGGPEMFSLCLWRELASPHRIVWEQSFCTREGVKCPPPFFNEWPLTLLTEVSLAPDGHSTALSLTWTPIEYDEAALRNFDTHRSSMTAGWTGSFDKLDEWLAR